MVSLKNWKKGWVRLFKTLPVYIHTYSYTHKLDQNDSHDTKIIPKHYTSTFPGKLLTVVIKK